MKVIGGCLGVIGIVLVIVAIVAAVGSSSGKTSSGNAPSGTAASATAAPATAAPVYGSCKNYPDLKSAVASKDWGRAYSLAYADEKNASGSGNITQTADFASVALDLTTLKLDASLGGSTANDAMDLQTDLTSTDADCQ